jgi:hypothetical protein
VIVWLDVSRLRRGFGAPARSSRPSPRTPGRAVQLGSRILKSGLEWSARRATFVSGGPQSRCRKSDRTAIFLDFSVFWWNFFVSIGEYLGLHDAQSIWGQGNIDDDVDET